jgi:hypothetical protein
MLAINSISAVNTIRNVTSLEIAAKFAPLNRIDLSALTAWVSGL